MASDQPFDVEAFLALPLNARLAAAGPSVRPVWYLWEDSAFWILTGPWSALPRRIAAEPSVALVVDTCDLTTGQVRQVIARGRATIEPFDPDRARRKLRRYLGPDEQAWDERFRDGGGATGFIRLRPDELIAKDMSYRASRTDR